MPGAAAGLREEVPPCRDHQAEASDSGPTARNSDSERRSGGGGERGYTVAGFAGEEFNPGEGVECESDAIGGEREENCSGGEEQTVIFFFSSRKCMKFRFDSILRLYHEQTALAPPSLINDFENVCKK